MENVYQVRQNFGKGISILIGIAIVIAVIAIAIGSSLVSIDGSKVGIVEKKFGGGKLSSGRILAVDGENGIQSQV
ncbi:MAG: hypothetical protein KAS96_09375, partial [Planctomycetes bacterium]|nr:hypothetical protein [Planctomycetota bacterium]